MLKRRSVLISLLAMTCFAGAASADGAALVEAAKKEGKVIWYSSVNVDAVVRPMAAAFEARYGIPVEYVTAGATDLAARLINEAQVGQVGGDVWDGSSTFPTLDAAGLTDAYKSPSAASFPAELRAADGKWYAQSVQYYGPAINTELVPKSDWPKTYQDLLNPRWNGKMAWPAETGMTSPVGLMVVLANALGDEQAKAFMEQLSAQKVANVPSGNRVVLDQAIAGEYEIAMMAQNIAVESSKEKGAPIEFLRLDPAVGVTSRIGVVKGGPNPNAARLFLDFVLSEDGQNVYRDAGYIPSNPAVAPANPALAPATGNFKGAMLDLEDFTEKKDHWVSVFESQFQ
ncbi:ABC transporter substrate-binding protein [Sinorhizobium mexicanum]|nr:extracellular solute-binding protein [Sinorhizobium mexicanum]MBP1888081.1 iron(III) transport system substrate-binding protein [Sinorhizobium mexicanum]